MLIDNGNGQVIEATPFNTILVKREDGLEMEVRGACGICGDIVYNTTERYRIEGEKAYICGVCWAALPEECRECYMHFSCVNNHEPEGCENA